MGKRSKPSVTTTTTAPPEWARPYIQQGMQSAQDLYNAHQGYTPGANMQRAIGALSGGPSQAQQYAQQQYQQLAKAGMDQGPVGGNWLNSRGLSIGPESYRPATSEELHREIEALTRGVRPSIYGAQAGVGGSGSVAADALIGREVADASARAYAGERDRSLTHQGQILGRYGQERGLEAQQYANERSMQVQRYGQERGQQLQSQLAGLQGMLGIDDVTMQRLLQSGELEDFFQRQVPQEALQNYVGAIGGMPIGQTSAQSQPMHRNRVGGAMGGALAGGQIGAMFGPAGAPFGAALGGLAGLLF